MEPTTYWKIGTLYDFPIMVQCQTREEAERCLKQLQIMAGPCKICQERDDKFISQMGAKVKELKEKEKEMS